MEKLKALLPQKRDAGEAALRSEAKYFANLISHKLEQLGVCYRYRRNEKDLIERGVQRVKFNLAVTQDEAIYLRIDSGPRNFPRGVSLADIDDTEILNDLSVVAQRPIRFKREGDGAWLIIERESGVFGIRAHLDFGEMLDHWPDSKKPMMVPLGLAANRRLVFQSLDDFPHALIGGATKSGKTTLTHAWICALALKHTPRQLRMILVDLKGGVEFTRYKELPHMWTYEKDDGAAFHGFIKDRADVIPALELIRWEMDRRLALFESAGGLQHIAAWNQFHRKNPLPRIVVFLDELASLMLEPDLKKDGERLLSDIGARGRAPGIHLVIATQRPEVSVVSGRIKGNLDARFGFRVPDNASSMVILDDGSASDFPSDTPRGRYIFKFGNDRREIQGPWPGPGVIRGIIKGILSGDDEIQSEAARLDPDMIFRFALTQNGGAFSIHQLYKLLKGKGVSQRYIEQLGRDYENELIELDGVLYRLHPADQFSPRMLKPVDSTDGETEHDNDAVTVLPTQPETPPTQTGTPPVQPGTALARIERGTDTPIIERVLRYAIDVLDGELSNRVLFDVFRGHVDQKDLASLLAEYDNTSVEIRGKLYFCEPGKGRRPRRLILVKEETHEG